jgi:hypothetical protein
MQCSCTYGQSSAGAVLRRGSVGVRCALSFCPPLQHQLELYDERTSPPLPPTSGWPAWPWVPKPFCRPPLHESAEGSSKSRSLGSAIHQHLLKQRKLEVVSRRSSVVPRVSFAPEPDFTEQTDSSRLSQCVMAQQILPSAAY